LAKRFRVQAAGAVAVALGVALSAYYSPQQEVPRFGTRVNGVALDVSVLDRDRLPVRGLTQADFTILEDGRPQAIQTFMAIDRPDAAPDDSAAWVREVAPDVQRNDDFDDRRLVVCVLDDATPMPAADVLRARQLARQVIEQLAPGDLAAVVYSMNASAGQTFTRDRARLLAAVDRFSGNLVNTNANTFDAFDRAAGGMYLRAVDTLRSVAEHLTRLPNRRKSLIWVSVGLPLDWKLAQPAELSFENPGDGTVSGQVLDITRSLQQMFAASQRANLNVYSVYTGGLRAPNDLAAPSADELRPGGLNVDFLHAVSANTGGFAITETNDVLPGLRQAFLENASYYLLGYASTNARSAGRFRKIEVRVNRPGMTVRARTGYWETTAREPARAAGAPVVDPGLSRVTPKTDLWLQLTAVPFPRPGEGRADVGLIVGIRQQGPMRATRVVQENDVRATAYTPDGRERASRREKVSATLNVPGVATTVGYEVFTGLELPPGRYHLRLAVDSSLRGIRLVPGAPRIALVEPGEGPTNRSGSVFYDLDVPDFAAEPLSLSGLVLSVMPAVASGPKGHLASFLPVVPTTLRQFQRDDQVSGFLRVCQGGKQPVAPVRIVVSMVDSRGATAFEHADTLEAARFANGRMADWWIEVPIARLKSGPHLLAVEATLGRAVARRDTRFEVGF